MPCSCHRNPQVRPLLSKAFATAGQRTAPPMHHKNFEATTKDLHAKAAPALALPPKPLVSSFVGKTSQQLVIVLHPHCTNESFEAQIEGPHAIDAHALHLTGKSRWSDKVLALYDHDRLRFLRRASTLSLVDLLQCTAENVGRLQYQDWIGRPFAVYGRRCRTS